MNVYLFLIEYFALKKHIYIYLLSNQAVYLRFYLFYCCLINHLISLIYIFSLFLNLQINYKYFQDAFAYREQKSAILHFDVQAVQNMYFLYPVFVV